MWTDMAAAYVLDALDPDEVREFEQRLEVDAALREEVRLQRETLGALADAVPERRAPASLKERILDEARSVRPIESVGAGHTADDATTRDDASTDAAVDSSATPDIPARRSMVPWALAAAATVA